MTWPGRLTVLLVLAAPVVASAQSPTDRAMLAAWDDSLQQRLTLSQLSQYDELARADKSDAKNLRHTLFKIRSAELRNDRPDLELALDNLSLDVSEHPTWAWPELAFFRTFITMEADRRPVLITSGTKYIEPYITAAWRHLALAIKRDPEMPETYRVAAAVLLPSGDRTLRAPEVAFLRAAINRPHPDPDLLLVWGRHIRSLRRYDSAQRIFTRAAFEGGDYSRLALERARTFVGVNDLEAATTAYWDGLQHLSKPGRELYRNDLAWIISADSLAVFDAVPDAGVVDWMRRFWNERDALSANNSGDRVLEQLLRWIVAFGAYRTDQPWYRANWNQLNDMNECRMTETKLYQELKVQPSIAGDPRARETIVDHRGIVYLRQGEPGVKVGGRQVSLAPLAEPEYALAPRAGEVSPKWLFDRRILDLRGIRPDPPEAWVYYIDGEWRVLSFKWQDSLGGSFLRAMPAYNIESLTRFLPEVAKAIKSNGPGPTECGGPVEKRTRSDAHLAIETDTDSPPIAEPWAAIMHAFALGRGGDGSGKALVTFAFGAKDLVDSGKVGDHIDFPISIRVVAYHAATDRTIQIDTVQHFYSTTRAGWVTGWLELPLPAGNWQLAIYARQEGTKGGAYTVRRDVLVDSVASLTLSDIVTGRADAPTWRAPDGNPFPVNPVGMWPFQGKADLYYEVRGLAEGTTYKTSIQLRTVESKGKTVLDVSTTDQATGLLTHVRKQLGLEKLNPGIYQVVVTVEANGKKAERTTTIVIGEP